MPELPEVETVIRTLRKIILLEKILDIEVLYNCIIDINEKKFKENIIGQKILKLHRYGKYILIDLENRKTIRIHLRMEGKIFVNNIDEFKEQKHTHIKLFLTNNKILSYIDVRKFGRFELIDTQKNWHNDEKFSQLGYEPFDKKFTNEWFYKKTKKSKKNIKSFLLDQKTILGLGNIYVDEVLFFSNINPKKNCKYLSFEEVIKIKKNSIKILNLAILYGGSTIKSYQSSKGVVGRYQTNLYVYGRENKKCKICNNEIKKIKINGRGTHFCPICQEE